MIDILKALAEETRLRIFAQIIKGDMCVCEIEECLELTQSNASRHLTALKRAGILDSYKTAQWAYYKVSDTFITEKYSLQGTTQGRYLTGGVPPVRFSM